MALTPEEFTLIQDYASKAVFLETASHRITELLREVVNRADPANPLNSNQTFNGLVALFGTVYTEAKTNTQTALDNMP